MPLAPAVDDILRSVRRIDGADYVFSTGRRRLVGSDDDSKPAPVSGFGEAKKLLDAAIVEVMQKELPSAACWPT